MKRHNLNLTTSPQKNFQDLISSIEGKLELLASENFDVSQKDPFAFSLPANVKDASSPAKSFLALEDLASPSPTPIMNRLDQIEQQYLTQISALNNRLSVLQTQNNELRKNNEHLQTTIYKLESELELIQHSNNKILESRLQELQQSLMHKLREQIQEEISNYIVELQQMRRDIATERKNNKQLESQRELLSMQRNNFQFLYREILDKYKKMLQVDIDNYERDSRLTMGTQYQQNKRDNEEVQIPRKSKDPLKKKKSKHGKQQEMSKQELIPFLTKGISQLKQKLKLK